AFDLVSILALFAIVLSFGRRLLVKPACLDSAYVKGRSPEAFVILGFIGLLMLAYFGMHGAGIALGQEDASAYMPVSRFLASLMGKLDPATLQLLENSSWWVHALVLLAFICYLPQSKHMHILTAIPNCFFQSLKQPNTQPREEFAKGNRYGAEKVDDF